MANYQQFELLKKSAVTQIATDLDQQTAERLKSWEDTRNYDTVYSFDDGFTIAEDERQKVALFDGEWYRWDGELPKTVPAGSTPASTGGVDSGAWRSVGDAALRQALANPDMGAAMVGYGNGTVADKLDEIVSGAVTEPIVDAKIGTHNQDANAHPELDTRFDAKVDTHNHDANSHTELRTSIVSEVSSHVTDAADRAEAASDAAFVNADVYETVAAGRAAVADGEQFQVIAGDGLTIIRYRRISSGDQVEVASYPSTTWLNEVSDIASNAGEGLGLVNGRYVPPSPSGLTIDTATKTLTLSGRILAGIRSSYVSSKALDYSSITTGIQYVYYDFDSESLRLIDPRAIDSPEANSSNLLYLFGINAEGDIFGHVGSYTKDGAEVDQNSSGNITVAWRPSDISIDTLNKKIDITNQVRAFLGSSTFLLPEASIDYSSQPSTVNYIIYDRSTGDFTIHSGNPSNQLGPTRHLILTFDVATEELVGFSGAGVPEYGFISGATTDTSTGYSPLALDSASQTITIQGRVVAGTRSFSLSEPVTLSYAVGSATFIVVSEEVGGTRLVPVASHSQIGAGDVIVGSVFPSNPPAVYGAPHYTVDGLYRGRDTAGIFPSSGVGVAATWPNDHFLTLTGSNSDVLTLWKNNNGSAERIADIGGGSGGGGGGHSVSYTLSIDTRTELADFNFAGNVIHHGNMRVLLDGQSRLVPEQDIALDVPRVGNQTQAVVLNPDTLELSVIPVSTVTPSSGVVLYYYNENKREVHTIYPYRIDGTLVKPENGESGLSTSETVIFNDAESPQLVIVDDSHTLEDPLPLRWSFGSSSLDSGDVYAWYDQLVDDFPQYVSRELMGMDASGVYPIYGYRFTPSLADTSNNEDTPRVFICAIHSETLNFVYTHVLMREICRSWDDNPRLAALRFGAEFLVMPCANPYGLDGRQRTNSNGVDINRNFPNGWILTEPGDYYSGSSPASEIETQTIINAVNDFSPHVALDCHAFHGGEDGFVWTPIVDPTYRMVTQTSCLQVYQKIVKQFPSLEDRTFNSFYRPTPTGTSSGGRMSKFFLASGAIGGTFEVSRDSVGGEYLTNEEIVTGASVLMNIVYEGIKTYKLYGAPRTPPQGIPQ